MKTQDIEKLQDEIKNINEKYEKLSEYVKTIVPKHENVMSSVLDHLVHQATTLKMYSAKSPHLSDEPPNTPVSLSNEPVVQHDPIKNVLTVQFCVKEYL